MSHEIFSFISRHEEAILTGLGVLVAWLGKEWQAVKKIAPVTWNWWTTNGGRKGLWNLFDHGTKDPLPVRVEREQEPTQIKPSLIINH